MCQHWKLPNTCPPFPWFSPLCLDALMLLLQAKTRNDVYLKGILVTSVSEPGQFEISNPGTTGRSGSFLRNAKCDFRFSTLPGEIVRAVQYSCRNVLWLAQLTHSTINQIVWGQGRGVSCKEKRKERGQGNRGLFISGEGLFCMFYRDRHCAAPCSRYLHLSSSNGERRTILGYLKKPQTNCNSHSN